MKAFTSVYTFLSIAALALTVGACGSGSSNNSNAAGIAAPGVTGCVYTQVGMLPQGSCPAGQGQIITAASGYTAGQCIPSSTANNGVYGNTGYPNTGVYPGYNTGYAPGYSNTGYGTTGYGSGLDGGQCTGQNGINGVNNGQCVQTTYGCLPQCPNQPGTLLYQGNCAPYSYFGVSGGTYPGYTNNGYGPYAPGYYNGGYVPGGGGNFGGYYYYRGI
jgi:hypothetical protein